MEKRYIMFAGLSATERISLLGMCGILVICALCAICAAGRGESPAASASRYAVVAVYNSLTFLFLAIVRLVLARDMLKTIWDVSETSTVRKSPTRIVSVDFAGITRFRYFHVPLVFRAGVIKHRAGTLFLSFYIKDLAELIADVRNGMDRFKNTKGYDASNLEEYVRVARMSDVRNDRLKRFMPALSSTMTVALCVSIVTSLSLWYFSLAQAFVWAVFVLLVFLLGVLFAEALLIFGVRGNTDADRNPREARAYLLAGMFAFVVCLCCGILLSTALAP